MLAILIPAALVAAILRGYDLFRYGHRFVESFYQGGNPLLPTSYFRCSSSPWGFGGGNVLYNDAQMAPGSPWPSVVDLFLNKCRLLISVVLAGATVLLVRLAHISIFLHVLWLQGAVILFVNTLFAYWTVAYSQIVFFPAEQAGAWLAPSKWQLWKRGLTDRGYYRIAGCLIGSREKWYAYNPWLHTWLYRLEILVADVLVVLPVSALAAYMSGLRP